jgi:hypothetical protein
MTALMNRTVPPRPSRNGGEFSLDRVATRGRKLPNRIVLHAKAGWGKTSFAAQVPGVVFLMIAEETGLWTLMDSGQLADDVAHFPQPAWAKHDLELAIAELAAKDHAYKAVCIDSITLVEKLLHEKTCREKFNDDWSEKGFNGFDRGPKAAAPEWDSILQSLDRLRERGMGVILLAHSKVNAFKNPEGPDYERWTPALSKYSWERVGNWADMVLFGNFETFAEKENKLDRKAKATGGQKRILLTEHHAAYDAKNRHGLPEEIDCGDSAKSAWANFKAALQNQSSK